MTDTTLTQEERHFIQETARMAAEKAAMRAASTVRALRENIPDEEARRNVLDDLPL